MKNKIVPTWQAHLFIGLRVGYTDEIFPVDKVYKICQEYVDRIGWCVTITPTKFIYKGGAEPGVIIGAIRYPRFPTPEEVLKDRVIKLAEILCSELGQFRVSIILPDETIMLEKENGKDTTD